VEPFVLVVMEHGSEWPAHVNGGIAGCIALRQESNEDLGGLLRRTYDRVHAIERLGGTVKWAVLSCNTDPSRGALEGRVPLARALLATVLRAGDGRLELLARSSASERTRQSLVGLAGALTLGLVGSSASVSACFPDAPAIDPATAHARKRGAALTAGEPPRSPQTW
jgi:hypothetical protein